MNYLTNLTNSLKELSDKYEVLEVSKSLFSNSCYITFYNSEFDQEFVIRVSDHRNRGQFSRNHIYSIFSRNGNVIFNKLVLKEIEFNISKFNKIGFYNTRKWHDEYAKLTAIYSKSGIRLGYQKLSNQLTKFA